MARQPNTNERWALLSRRGDLHVDITSGDSYHTVDIPLRDLYWFYDSGTIQVDAVHNYRRRNWEHLKLDMATIERDLDRIQGFNIYGCHNLLNREILKHRRDTDRRAECWFDLVMKKAFRCRVRLSQGHTESIRMDVIADNQ